LNTGAFEEQERIVQFPDDQTKKIATAIAIG